MQITLNERELLSAIEDYVRSRINIAPSQRLEIDLKAGRGDNGFSAILDISRSADPELKSEAADKPQLEAGLDDPQEPEQEAGHASQESGPIPSPDRPSIFTKAAERDLPQSGDSPEGPAPKSVFRRAT